MKVKRIDLDATDLNLALMALTSHAIAIERSSGSTVASRRIWSMTSALREIDWTELDPAGIYGPDVPDLFEERV